jgi:gliding motility-associated-like protein
MITKLRHSTISFLAFILAFSTSFEGNAQFGVDTTLTDFQYINNLVGLGVSFNNVQFQGDGQAIGFFTGASGNLGFNSGIVLSTGRAADADQPTANFAGEDLVNGLVDLPELTSFVPGCAGATNDGLVLQFDFVPQSSPVSFRYIFASEEFDEFVCSQFNDAFAFLISGPGIVGEQNLAVVPGTGDPITINTINNGSPGAFGLPNNDPCITTNSQYFNTNGPTDIVYDGYTLAMTAVTDVVPCSTYTLRLILADGCDDGYDSAVFLEANSFGAAPIAISQTTLNGDSTTFEGCAPAQLVFSRQNPDPFDYVFPFTLGGTAINGVDYAPIPPSITIPAGQTSVTLSITGIADGVTEGVETIELDYETICGTISTVVFLTEPPAVIVTPDPAPSLCGGQGPVTISGVASGGIPGFTYSWSDGLGTATTASVNPLATTTYVLTATDYCGATGTASITVPVGTTPAVPVMVLPVSSICEGEDINITASTTTAAASLVWTGPNSFTANGVGAIQIPNATVANDGVYSVYSSLTGCNSVPATVSAIVKPKPTIPVVNSNTPVCEGTPLNLTAAVTPGNSVITWTGPISFSATGAAVTIASTTMAAGGVYAASATLNGCNADSSGSGLVVINDSPDAPDVISNSPVCTTFNLDLSTTVVADSYLWTGPGAWTSTAQNPTRNSLTMADAGTYSLVITINGCPSPATSVTVEVIDVAFVPPIITNSPVCEGSPLEFSTSTVSGAQYVWNGPASASYSLATNSIPQSEEANEGIYSLYIVIGACTTATSTSSIVINPIPVADAGLDIQLCSMQPGGIGTTSTPGYSYSWAPMEGLNFTTISNPTVQIGNLSHSTQVHNYTVTVSANGCSNTSSVRADIISQPVASFVAPNPQCYEGNSFNFEAGGIWESANPRFIWDLGPWSSPDSSALQNPQDVHFNATGLHLVRFQIIDQGCPSNIYIAPVNVKPMPVANFISSEIVTCEPSLIHFTNLSENDGLPMNFVWDFGNGKSSTSTNPEILYSNAGSYAVKLRVNSSNGCFNEYNIPNLVTVHPTPTAGFNLNPQVLNISFPEVEVTAVSANADDCTYYFGNGDTLNVFEGLYSYPDTGSYTIKQVLSNNFGCRDSAVQEIRVDLGYKVYIPTAFTPNDDGLNDVFRVYGEDFASYSISIYNRWGELLYTSYDHENGWDGKIRLSDEKVPGGSYVYTIKLTDKYGLPYTYRGEITVLR